MKILLTRDWLGNAKGDDLPKQYRSGDRISILHWPGARLLKRRVALWIESEEGDPAWPDGLPPLPFRALRPEVDKMIRTAANKHTT